MTCQPKLQLNINILTSMKKTHCFNFIFFKAAQETPLSGQNLDLKTTTTTKPPKPQKQPKKPPTTQPPPPPQHAEMQAIQKEAFATPPGITNNIVLDIN